MPHAPNPWDILAINIVDGHWELLRSQEEQDPHKLLHDLSKFFYFSWFYLIKFSYLSIVDSIFFSFSLLIICSW